jgi:hypothetical protein
MAICLIATIFGVFVSTSKGLGRGVDMASDILSNQHHLQKAAHFMRIHGIEFAREQFPQVQFDLVDLTAEAVKLSLKGFNPIDGDTVFYSSKDTHGFETLSMSLRGDFDRRELTNASA